ncbi:MAG: trypsin-like peptidase domain-containing protein [Armatimonadota bacterium]|nr:MAG: trypsin-like peptidase domain-containing protein [Armatimonadota bacterium]
MSRESQDAVTAAIARVGPAVVNINTLYRPVVRDPMERVLREIIGSPSDPFPKKGQGSGIIIDGKQGYVLTNAHVVAGASSVEVNLADGRRLEATVVGVDPFSEIAVLQVPGGDLPTATLGRAADLPIGSWVIAIGNPFGFENSVTVGVISAKDRTLTGPNRVTLHDLLQTDASINPGNSGGALVDLNGDVVGVPTAIIPYAQGMGFAVSVDVAKQVAERLIATGKTPWLGITHQTVTPGLAEEIGLPAPKGSLVVEVVRGGPAARAGILPGDVIVRVGDREIDTARSLGFAVRSHDAGAGVPVTIWRKGRERTVEVTLGAVPM